MSPIKFLSQCPFFHITGTFEVSARIYKVKAMQIMFFVVCIKLSENSSPIKLYQMIDIPNFPSESSIENKIVNVVIFCIYYETSHLFVETPFATFPPLTPLLIIVFNHKHGLWTRFLFFVLLFDHGCKITTTTKG